MPTLDWKQTFKHLCHALVDLTHQEGLAIRSGQWEKMEPLLRHKTHILKRIENMDLKNFDQPNEPEDQNDRTLIESLLTRMSTMEAENRQLLEQKMSIIKGEMKTVKDQWKAQDSYLKSQA